MQAIYFTAGPSQLYPSYQKHLEKAMELQLGSINHRSESFRKIYQHTDEQLRQLMNIPSTHAIFFAASATEVWEKMILNLVETSSFHFVNGAFSKKFYDFATSLGKHAQAYLVKEGEGFDIHQAAIVEHNELICTTQNETSTGVTLPIEDISLLKNKFPHQLLCTDLVSIAPYSQIDFNSIDSAFFSVQKAFGMPPGLGVWIVNDNCREQAQKLQEANVMQGAHHTLASYYTNYKKFETPSTPNVIAIYILGKIAEDMNRSGILQIRQDIDDKAKLLYDFIANQNKLTCFVKDPKFRSQTVGVFDTQFDSSELIHQLKQNNLVISNGYGNGKNKQIRIANFPATNIEDMQLLLNKMEETL
jgi:phosphoserine aminotransferase